MKNIKVDYKIISDNTCKICKRPLKQNVINRNRTVDKCYVCNCISKGHETRLIVHKKNTRTINYKQKQQEQIKTYGNIR